MGAIGVLPLAHTQPQAANERHILIASSSAATTLSEGRLGRLRTTGRTSPVGPDVAASYTQASRAVKANGLLVRAKGFYLLVATALVLATAADVAGMVLLGHSWFQLILAGVLGLILTQFAFLAHEAAHRQILTSGPANDRLGRFLATFVIGMSYAWWMNKHSRHHANPNQVGKDPDIAVDTISFLEEDAAKRTGVMAWITRRQGYLFFPLLSLEGVNLHVTSTRILFGRDAVKRRKTEIALIATRFALYLGVLFVFLPPGMAAAFIGVQFAVFGIYMGASFAPNHKGMPIIPRDLKLDFFSKQVLTSRNITGGWWATTLFGGLNYQVEHHLFPSMARPHLSKARLLVREHCLANGIDYTETTMMESYSIVIAYLNRVGLHARDPFACPMVAQYRGA
ncbi:acyl-CoA desaturase [Humibacter ginsenosidimutans]|uniref:Acyl-CoA desaturase n=1 Tax=Humibacter ginsenosidimutans TaxID=2599293 RepID=A0A5B8M2N1_9MICO|nr:acyl-CoA desaturase [Humibacter ginsenosidimutans]